MTRHAAFALLALAGLIGLPDPAPAAGRDPLAVGAASRDAVLEEIRPFAEWRVRSRPVAFGRTEVRIVDDFAHVRAVLTLADGSAIDPESLGAIRPAAVPVTVSGILRRRGGRWLLVDIGVERADPVDPDGDHRHWDLPKGLLPPACEHRRTWPCGTAVPR